METSIIYTVLRWIEIWPPLFIEVLDILSPSISRRMALLDKMSR